MGKFQLRDYQQKCKDLVSGQFRKGHSRIMPWLPTGAGKGLLMANFVKESIDKNMKVLTVMKRRSLIFQTKKNYKKYYNIDSSVIMGNITHDVSKSSFVCSADTLPRRITNQKYNFLRGFDVVIIDECHDCTSLGYKKIIWFFEGYDLKDFNETCFENIKDKFKKIYIGLTATPFRVGKKTHTFWQSVVKPIEAYELRDRGFLVDALTYAPRKMDTSGLRISNSDFDQKQLFERVSKLEIIGDTVENYKEFGQGKPAICFCVNTVHSKMVAEAFRRAGIPAIHCDADHSEKERDDATKGLKDGTYKILTNCNIFSTGFDAPFIEVGLFARPTESEILFIQQIGRILRPYKVCANCSTEYGGDSKCYVCGSSDTSYVKNKAIILDHANNTSRWGLPYDVRQPELEPIDTVRKNRINGAGVKDCPKCHGVIKQSERYCVCGYDFVEGSQQNALDKINQVDGKLELVNNEFIKKQTYQKIKNKYNSYKRLEMLRHWNPNTKFIKLYEDFEEDLFEYSKEFGITRQIKKDLRNRALYKSAKGLMDNSYNLNVNDKVVS
jgi:superfamily II DNA or RNA helicase